MSSPPRPESTRSRRDFFAWCSGIGLGATLFPEALASLVQDGSPVSRAAIAQAEQLAGLVFTDAERSQLERLVNQRRAAYERLRARPLADDVAPCLYFDPVAPGRLRPPATARRVVLPPMPSREAPGDLRELAFATVAELSALLRERAVTSVELTELFLARIEQHDPTLFCTVTLLKERALAQAKAADAELDAGKWRGPLHGVPWGAKDLLYTKGARTTFGAEPWRDFVPEFDAAVVERLDAAGAVLIAKLSLGALAMGDLWFGGMTRNPWNPQQGSSGSSAGSASAAAAGLVPFAIGSETLGSIVSPSTRCGTTGLRPTFGRVSRHGAMALSWTMDKLGPLCRNALDCALVFAAIEGRDERDRTTVDLGFDFDANRPLAGIKIGYLKAGFPAGGPAADRAVLEVLRAQGATPESMVLPDAGASDLADMLIVEGACAFDEPTRDGRLGQLREQGASAWPNLFRAARFFPAVEFLRAARLRTQFLEATAQAFADFDVIVTPPFAGEVLALTNLTGHPALVLPNGFHKDGTPTSITLVGKLYGEAELLRVGAAFQAATDHHTKMPPQFAV